MNSLWQPPNYGPTGIENQLYNTIFQSHDIGCGCKDPILHLLQIISKNNKKKPSIKQLKEIKWLLTGEEEDRTTADTGDDVIEPGDLDILFALDGEEKDTAATG